MKRNVGERNLHMVKAIMDSHVRDSAIPFVIRGHFNDRTQLGLCVYSSLCVCARARVFEQQISFGGRCSVRCCLRECKGYVASACGDCLCVLQYLHLLFTCTGLDNFLQLVKQNEELLSPLHCPPRPTN
jgi:hypothetical protein